MQCRKDFRESSVSRAIIFVVIPTKDRRQCLVRALRSIALQSFRPTATLVVGDAQEDIEGLGTSLADFSPEQGKAVPLVPLVNKGARNLSGSLNTALSHILNEMHADPATSYIAFLDDDDSWDREYLEECFTSAINQDLDWVIAGITRHEADDEEGVDLTIPPGITIHDFLTTNPHVQGSNLFLRLSSILKAGCFDENLESTTDRDVAIRLLSLGNTRVGFLQHHLVHHMAGGPSRLSSPGSESKRHGLIAFYQKYSPTMSEPERVSFADRACRLFGCMIQDFAGAFGG